MRKKAITGLLGMMLAAQMMLPVSAAETEKKQTTVKYQESNDWIVTIPAEVTLSASQGTECSITASKINIEPGKELQVSILSGISSGQVTLSRTNGTSADDITSTVRLTENASGGISQNEVVAKFSGSAFTGTIRPTYGGTLYFSSLGGDIKAGSYTGTITFSMSVADTASSGD